MTPPPRVLRDKGGFLSPVVSLVSHEGRPAVLKDYRSKNAVTRSVLAPVLVKREYKILRLLEAIPGIPRAYAILDGRALLMQYVEGRTLSKFHAGDLPDDFYARFRDIVHAMHRRGVVHLDLRQRKNILVDGEGRPWILDFANAVHAGRLAPELKAVDESALLKFKKRNFPHLLTAADRKALEGHRFLRRFWVFTPRGKSVR